jgi:hypothetical protein
MPSYNDIIPPGQSQFGNQLVSDSTQTPPNAIAYDGLSHLFGDGKTDSGEPVFSGALFFRLDPGTRSALQDQTVCYPFTTGPGDTEKLRTLFQAFHRNGHKIKPTDACGPWRGVR